MEEEYLVRGALLACSCGSHPRRLNMEMDHGVYVINKPVTTEQDIQVEENIRSFGVCRSENPPEGAETVCYEAYNPGDPKAYGPCCCPEINEEGWKKVSEKTIIDGEGHCLTTNSYCVCVHGGIIECIESGQGFEG